MKLSVTMTLAALMFMAPAIYARDTVTPRPPTGPNAKGLETMQPSKEMAKSEQPIRQKNKKKRAEPLTPQERTEMERRLEVTEPTDSGDAQVK